jgi:hypothetical protein
MPDLSDIQTVEHDVVVIGAGGAGLRAAPQCGLQGLSTGLVCKSLLGKAHTVMAEGGCAAALGNVDPHDNWKIHFRDTMRGGKFLNDWRMAELHAPQAPARGRERTKITLFFADHTSGNMLRIKEAAYGFFDEHPMEISRGRFHLAGGSIGLEIALNEEMKAMHFQMDVAVLGAIFLMCWLAFRSLVAGIMLTLPLILSNLVAYTYMSFADIGLTTSTLPCAAVGVGVGVDFAIYLYSRCIEEFRQQDDWETTILRSVRTGGKGILFSGITLILPLAAWYLIAPLKFQAQMGFFLAMLLFVNMAAAFTLHHMMIMLIKPSFMKRSRDAAQRIGTEEQDVRSLFSKHHGSTN